MKCLSKMCNKDIKLPLLLTDLEKKAIDGQVSLTCGKHRNNYQLDKLRNQPVYTENQIQTPQNNTTSSLPDISNLTIKSEPTKKIIKNFIDSIKTILHNLMNNEFYTKEEIHNAKEEYVQIQKLSLEAINKISKIQTIDIDTNIEYSWKMFKNMPKISDSIKITNIVKEIDKDKRICYYPELEIQGNISWIEHQQNSHNSSEIYQQKSIESIQNILSISNYFIDLLDKIIEKSAN